MIRALLMVAAAGFVLAIASFALAITVGGPELMARGAWAFGPSGWNWDDDDEVGRDEWASSPSVTRTFAWTGGDRLRVEVPGDVKYTQAPGPARLTITGPEGVLDRVEVEGGAIKWGRSLHRSPRLTIVMTAPDVTRFELNGRDRLTLQDYDQPTLDIDLSGNAEVVGNGKAGDLTLEVSGSGEARLGDLPTKGAKVEISGAGEAEIAPSDWAELAVSGAGEIFLLTRPARLTSDVSGSGTIRQGTADPVSPPISPPAAPMPPSTPPAKRL